MILSKDSAIINSHERALLHASVVERLSPAVFLSESAVLNAEIVSEESTMATQAYGKVISTADILD